MTGVTPSSRGFLEPVAHLGQAEIGLILFDRFALVVEDGFAVGDPAQGLPRFLGFRLDFLDHHAAHAVGVLESGLQWTIFTRCELADMLFAQNAAGAGGVLPPANHDRAIRKFLFGLAKVIDVPGGGVAEPRRLPGPRRTASPYEEVGEFDPTSGWPRRRSNPVRLSPSLPLPFTTMAVGRPSTSKNTSDRLSLMSCISRGASTRKVELRYAGGIVHRVSAGHHKQVVRVVCQRGEVVEGVGVTFRQVEMLRGIRRKAGDAGADPVLARQFGRRYPGKTRGEFRAAEVTAGFGMVELGTCAACAVNGLIQLVVAGGILEDCLKQAFGQCQLIVLIGQAQPSVLTKGQWIDQILGKVKRSRMLDQTLLILGPIGNGLVGNVTYRDDVCRFRFGLIKSAQTKFAELLKRKVAIIPSIGNAQLVCNHLVWQA